MPESLGARGRGALRAALGAALGTGALALGFPGLGTVVLVAAGATLLAALASPNLAYAALERLFAATGHRVGRVLTWLLLVPLFYGFFLPFGRLMRRGRRDRLQRSFEPDRPSYWEPHQGPRAGSASHRRQY